MKKVLTLFEKMWPDDIHWLPLFLSGEKFMGKILQVPDLAASVAERRMTYR